MKRRTIFGAIFAACLALGAPVVAQDLSRIERQVRHEIITLPYLSIFDHIVFRVDDGKVTLMGDVSRPTLKSGAEKVVKRIEGVREVDNQIKVLPVSANDDRIRTAVSRAIYYHPQFTRYAIRAIPPIHIVVKNGDVRLEGNVATEMDKNIAGVQANGVAGVFSVTNNLAVEKK